MATARFLINGALRRIGVLAAGREARLADATDALDGLKGLYSWLITSGAFGRLRDVMPLASYTACGNERILRNQSSAIEITLPDTIPANQWWPYCDGWGPYPLLYQGNNTQSLDRTTPRDCSVVVIVDAFVQTTENYIYDASVKRWQLVSSIGLDDEAPLSERDPEGMRALLATRIADQFGAEVPMGTQMAARDMLQGLTSRFSSPRQEACGVYI
jgi:hypothetical protein